MILSSVHVKIKEGNRERVQEFKGTVLYTRNNGASSTFTVRRIASNGIGVERVFLTRFPRVSKRLLLNDTAKFADHVFIICVNLLVNGHV